MGNDLNVHIKSDADLDDAAKVVDVLRETIEHYNDNGVDLGILNFIISTKGYSKPKYLGGNEVLVGIGDVVVGDVISSVEDYLGYKYK